MCVLPTRRRLTTRKKRNTEKQKEAAISCFLAYVGRGGEKINVSTRDEQEVRKGPQGEEKGDSQAGGDGFICDERDPMSHTVHYL